MKLATPSAQLKHQDNIVGRRLLPTPLAVLILGALLLASIFLAVSFGSIAIPVGTIAQILLNGTGIFHFARHWDPTAEEIVWQVRMPIVIGVAFVGAALSTAGVLFQGMLRNPLADPFLIGTSSGAALGAAVAFVLPFDTIYGSFFPLTPLLAWVVINAVLVALQTLILTLSPHAQVIVQSLFNWLSGGIEVISWPPVFIVGAITLAGIVFSLILSGSLDAFALGEEGAAHLGLHVERRKLLIIIVGSLLTAAAVSISGLIGFVGLVIPHAMRLLLGPRHRLLLPVSALGGAIFLILADLLARVVIAPAVLPVGVFTALVGAPFFLFLLRSSKRAYRW